MEDLHVIIEQFGKHGKEGMKQCTLVPTRKEDIGKLTAKVQRYTYNHTRNNLYQLKTQSNVTQELEDNLDT